ncbi:HORMA domain-containing protein 1 [Apodemus speciosus]|uniref:HORMA domain-containing protein 1 n=1 Tax=Apodemus speciosus TaxID=105296 RepID=A0ABQ0EM42_APOSI
MSALVFPNKISTENQSLMFVKRLLAVSVSCITYLRGIFPERAYGTRYLDDLCVKILKEDKNCPGSSQLVKWMLGCYDALQKKYLRMIILAVYTNPEDPQAVPPTSTSIFIKDRDFFLSIDCPETNYEAQAALKFTEILLPPPPGATVKNQNNKSSTTSSETKKASILLIRKIYVLMQNLGPLPNDVCLTMKLFYYDEVTPPDYQPPGFKDGDCEGVIFDGDPTYLNVGEVPTPFHTLRLKVTTEKERMENIDSTILTPKQSKIPFQKILMDKDDVEDENHNNFDFKTKMNEQNENSGTSEIKEPNLDCKEEEIMQFQRSQSSSISHCQVEQLVSKTSELDVSESKTRSGKIFQSKMVNVNQQRQTSKENRKRSLRQSGKTSPSRLGI